MGKPMLILVLLACVFLLVFAASGINPATAPQGRQIKASMRPRLARLVTLYDPTRGWKREHRIALIGASALGAFVCLLYAFLHTKTPYDWMSYELNYRSPRFEMVSTGLPSVAAFFYFLRLAFWAAFGGVVGGSVVYIAQLLRK